MRSFPHLPDVRGSESPDDLLTGHLWLLELLDGTGLRFRMDESGLLRFGDPETTYADAGEIPPAVRPAVRYVRDRFDREAFRDAVDEPEEVTFLGVATHHRGTDYDWERLPPFLGTDVWTGPRGGLDRGANTESEAGSFRPPDAATAIFEGIGLGSVNAIEREVNARDFDPEAYEIPGSAWRDGPAAGVVVRNKRGGRGKLLADRAAGEERAPASDDPETIAAAHATGDRFDRVIDDLDRRGEGVTVDAVTDRVVELIARETPVRFGGGGTSADPDRVRAAIIERARVALDDR